MENEKLSTKKFGEFFNARKKSPQEGELFTKKSWARAILKADEVGKSLARKNCIPTSLIVSSKQDNSQF